MKPYYSSGGITILHGDCLKLLPELPGCAIVADQPYGTGWARGGGGVGEFAARHEQPVWDRWDLGWLDAVVDPVAIACFGPWSRRDELVERIGGGVLWYRKTNPRPRGPHLEPIAFWPTPDNTGAEFSAYNGDAPYHACQKPDALMRWVLEHIPADATILDPFMGSGTTLRAAKDLGRRAIGIEI